MTTPHQEDQAEPFFITEEVEAELIAAGHMFEPPGHVSTKRLPEILASLTDDELAIWPGVLSKGEIERRRAGSNAKSDDCDSTSRRSSGLDVRGLNACECLTC